MAGEDRARWDAYYEKQVGHAYPYPDPLLFQFVPPAPSGVRRVALDLAAGVGQNGLWLAEQGYIVDLMDISRIALRRAQDEIVKRDLRGVNLLPVDLDDIHLKPDSYDLISVFRYLKRDLLPDLRAALKHGGRIVYVTFNIRHTSTNGDPDADDRLALGELTGYFADWHMLHHDESSSLSAIIARKP